MGIFRDFIESVKNLHEFLFYFFSVKKLFLTLFRPWKNITSTKKWVGLDLNEWLNKFSLNLISISIGFMMRLSLILFYFILEIIFLFSLPELFLIYCLYLPILLVTKPTNQEIADRKALLKEQFVSSHLTDEKNRAVVEQWFEVFYAAHEVKKKTFSKSNLFSVPPLARDWSSGFTPVLDQFSDDLTEHTYQSRIPNVIDRKNEIDLIERTLIKSAEANVLIVGEEGVGKHTIVDALARKMYYGQSADELMYKRLLKVNMAKILSSTTDFQQRITILETLFEEAAQAKNVLIFIDDFEKYVDYVIPIEKYAKDAAIHFIGITNPFSYQQVIFPNDKIVRLFTKIDVYEITRDEALHLLMANAYSFEKKYQVIIPYEVLSTLIEKCDYYITVIPFPEKAVDLLDQACVYATQKSKTVLTTEIIDQVITEKTHIPSTLTQNMKTKLLALQAELKTMVIGQNRAIEQITLALERSFLLMGKRKNPLSRMLFLGPTGVGKTETAKMIAKFLFDGQEHFIRFDMSMFQQLSDISELIGSSQNGKIGLLVSAIREHPYGVLLLDEIEKADSNLRNIFLTMLDEGYMVDGWGKRVDCKNLVIVATSNAHPTTETNLLNYLIDNHIFSPEFLNRFDAVVEFLRLDVASIKKVAEKIIDDVSQEIYTVYKVHVRISDDFVDRLAETYYNPQFGARDMQRLIKQAVEEKVATKVLENKVHDEETIVI